MHERLSNKLLRYKRWFLSHRARPHSSFEEFSGASEAISKGIIVDKSEFNSTTNSIRSGAVEGFKEVFEHLVWVLHVASVRIFRLLISDNKRNVISFFCSFRGQNRQKKKREESKKTKFHFATTKNERCIARKGNRKSRDWFPGKKYFPFDYGRFRNGTRGIEAKKHFR